MLNKPILSPKFSSAIVTGLLLLLTGCNSGEAIEGFLSSDPELSNSQDSTVTSSTSSSSSQDDKPIATEKPELEATEERQEPEFTADLPPEIPLYPDAIIETAEPDGEEAGILVLRSQSGLESIVSYYQEQFEQNEWEIIQPFSPETEEQNQTIISTKDSLKVRVDVIPQPDDSTAFNRIAIAYQPFDNSLSESSELLETSDQESVNTFYDLEEVSEQLLPAIKEVAALDILTPHLEEGEIKKFAPNEFVTRRDYARWLVAANNKYYAQSPGKKIRLATPSSELAFQDIKPDDPDFGAIQGLAEAGLIPSILTQESDNLLFRPDAPLTREDLLVWKVPLDIRKALPKASMENIQETWGFQDANSIDALGLRALLADFQNGDRSNVRRIFGYTTLFQPKKAVTRGEAAASIWYFGFQGDGITAKEALKITE